MFSLQSGTGAWRRPTPGPPYSPSTAQMTASTDSALVRPRHLFLYRYSKTCLLFSGYLADLVHTFSKTSTSILMSVITDIDICYSNIGRKYVRLKTVIPISEESRYRHQSPYRYPLLKLFFLIHAGLRSTPLDTIGERITTQPWR